MRDYALHEARMRQSHGKLTPVARIYRNWQTRRRARHILALSDHQLADIGLCRSDVHWMIRQPLTSDLGFEYERMRYGASGLAARNRGPHG